MLCNRQPSELPLSSVALHSLRETLAKGKEIRVNFRSAQLILPKTAALLPLQTAEDVHGLLEAS